ncbi:MAG: radical SAM protein [Syntrophobacteraceae bacterium]
MRCTEVDALFRLIGITMFDRFKKKYLNLSNKSRSIKPNFGGIYLEITDRCNMSCPMCITRNHREDPESSLLTMEEIVEKIFLPSKGLGVKMIAISGGEPTLSKNLICVLNQALLNELSIFLATNALHSDMDLYKRILMLLNSPRHAMNVSFDSVNKDEMHVIRGRDVYDKVLDNIRMIIKYKVDHKIQTDLQAAIILQEANINSVHGTIDFLLNLGFNRVVIQARHDYHNVCKDNLQNQVTRRYSPEVIRRFMELSSELFDRSLQDGRIRVNGESKENWILFYNDPLKIAGPCKGTNMIYVDAYGNLRGCISGATLGNIKSQDLTAFIHSREYREFVKFSKICKICIHGCS